MAANISLFEFRDIIDRYNTYLDDEHLNIKKDIFWKLHSQINHLFTRKNETLYNPPYNKMKKAFDLSSTMEFDTCYTIPKENIPRLFKFIVDIYQSEMV